MEGFVQLDEGSNATISVKNNNIELTSVGDYEVVYLLTDKKGKEFERAFTFSIVDTAPPSIQCDSSITIDVDSKFDPLKYVKATDICDGDITDKIKILTNTVNTNAEGTYIVSYSVKDAAGNSGEKDLQVIVKYSYSDNDLDAIKCIQVFMKRLKNPDSLKIHSVEYSASSVGGGTVKMDYSAQNSYGGMNRSSVYIDMLSTGFIDDTFQFRDELQIVSATYWNSSRATKLDANKINKAVLE